MSFIVDRENGSYETVIGGAIEGVNTGDLFARIITITLIVVVIMLLVIFQMIRLRRRRLRADVWLSEN